MPARLYRTPLASHETLEDRQGGRAGEGGRWHSLASPLSGILLPEQVAPLQEERHHRLPHVAQEGDSTAREIHGWSRRLGWLVVCLTVVLLGAGDAAAAEPKKFTVMNVVLDGTKIWLPSSLIVQQGDEVELTLINKLEDPHGFKIAEVGIEEVVQPKAQMTVRFTASQPGVYSYICHLHPPHIGGQIFVLSK